MEIKSSKPSHLRQMDLKLFMKPKQDSTEIFMPIDRTEPLVHSQKPQKRGRGRPRKYDLDDNRSQSRSPIQQQIEEVKDLNENGNSENQVQIKSSRGHYHTMDYATKLKVVQRFIQFKENQPIINGKRQSFEEFYKSLGEELNEKWSTIKSLCLAYNQNNSILLQLEFLNATQSSAKKNGQILPRSAHLTYGDDLDKILVDWIYGSIEVGYIQSFSQKCPFSIYFFTYGFLYKISPLIRFSP